MTIGELLKIALGASSISALVGTRVYPMNLPQTPTYPAITYQRISNTEQDGTSDRRRTRYQIDCWGVTYGSAQGVVTAVKAHLEGYHASPGIERARVVNEYDDFDDVANVYRQTVDVILHTTGD